MRSNLVAPYAAVIVKLLQGPLYQDDAPWNLLLAVDNFELIDWHTVIQRIQNLSQQLQELEASSTHLETLRDQRDAARNMHSFCTWPGTPFAWSKSV